MQATGRSRSSSAALPGSGKTTLGAALAPTLNAALIDLDVATGPLTAVVLELVGAADLDDPDAARLTRGPRYETVLGLAQDSLRAGTPVVVVAPLSAERDADAWTRVTDRLTPFADVHLVWLVLDRRRLAVRLGGRQAPRDAAKLQDLQSYLAAVDIPPPSAACVVLDSSRPVPDLVQAVLDACVRE